MINILLSTYRPPFDYLSEFIQSLRAQTLSDWLLHVRDDGSGDKTAKLLRERFQDRRICFSAGINLKPARSFFELLKNADPRCAYFAFADQDDYWHPEKLARAITRLAVESENQPLLYASRLTVVDERRHFQRLSTLPRVLAFDNALVENVVTGCTMVLNRAARELLLRQLPTAALMHDWWCYLVISSRGKVIFDDFASVEYRQHQTNVLGTPSNFLAQYRRRFQRFFSRRLRTYQVHTQAQNFYNIFKSELTANQRTLVEDFLHSKDSRLARWRYVWRCPLKRQTLIDNILLRLLIALGLY